MFLNHGLILHVEDIVNSSSLIDSAAEGDLSGLDRRDDFMGKNSSKKDTETI